MTSRTSAPFSNSFTLTRVSRVSVIIRRTSIRDYSAFNDLVSHFERAPPQKMQISLFDVEIFNCKMLSAASSQKLVLFYPCTCPFTTHNLHDRFTRCFKFKHDVKLKIIFVHVFSLFSFRFLDVVLIFELCGVDSIDAGVGGLRSAAQSCERAAQ